MGGLFIHDLVGLFVTPLGWGLMYYFVPIMLKKPIWSHGLSLVGFWGLVEISEGSHYAFSFFGYDLTPVRVDKLSLVFGYIFHIAAFFSVVYSLHVKDAMQHVCGLIYAGAAVSAVFAIG